VLLNGHGGNIVPASQAVFEARQRYRGRDDLLLLGATYWLLRSQPRDENPAFVQDRMGHACEWETSMILKLAPHLVGGLGPIEPVPFGNPFEPGARGWITRERSTPGHIGDPRQTSVVKGEILFRLFAGDVAAFLDRVIAWDGRSWDG